MALKGVLVKVMVEENLCLVYASFTSSSAAICGCPRVKIGARSHANTTACKQIIIHFSPKFYKQSLPLGTRMNYLWKVCNGRYFF